MAIVRVAGGTTALVDDEDRERAEQHKWYLMPNGYVQATPIVNGKTTHIYLHRLVMNAQPGQEIDHKNGDKTDCRKENLRFCTESQNQANRRKSSGTSSQYKGVSRYKRLGSWQAFIHTGGVFRGLGYFKNEDDAARAYDRKARELFGEFARCNFG